MSRRTRLARRIACLRRNRGKLWARHLLLWSIEAEEADARGGAAAFRGLSGCVREWATTPEATS